MPPPGSSTAKPYTPAILLLIAMWLGMGIPLMFSYESAMEEVQKGLRMGMLLLPLLLLLALMAIPSFDCCISTILSGVSRLIATFFPPPADPSSIHSVGGSPWGLTAFLLLILIMIWYQSDIHDYWNPLLRS